MRLAADEFEFVIADEWSVFLSESEDVTVLRRLCRCSITSADVSLTSRVESKKFIF